ncbi:hypothetical protein Fmac_031241 [Flemingia macrophylla]|uniref:Uncharacterized protein n=1 Tax=Flemingia macrophylla TaxID=520843 RepID=A0ABD1L1I6_9FABA
MLQLIGDPTIEMNTKIYYESSPQYVLRTVVMHTRTFPIKIFLSRNGRFRNDDYSLLNNGYSSDTPDIGDRLFGGKEEMDTSLTKIFNSSARMARSRFSDEE